MNKKSPVSTQVNMNQIIIRKADINDLSALRNIGIQTFIEAFSKQNTDENMRNYLEEKFSTEQLSKELANPDSLFFFAEEKQQVIGYLKLNTGDSQTETQPEPALEIERIYVLQAFHGKQVGQLLYNRAIEVAKDLGVPYIWLGVWEENLRAIQFYRKNGFAEFGKHIFKLGDDEQTDIMMKRMIQSASE